MTGADSGVQMATEAYLSVVYRMALGGHRVRSVYAHSVAGWMVAARSWTVVNVGRCPGDPAYAIFTVTSDRAAVTESSLGDERVADKERVEADMIRMAEPLISEVKLSLSPATVGITPAEVDRDDRDRHRAAVDSVSRYVAGTLAGDAAAGLAADPKNYDVALVPVAQFAIHGPLNQYDGSDFARRHVGAAMAVNMTEVSVGCPDERPTMGIVSDGVSPAVREADVDGVYVIDCRTGSGGTATDGRIGDGLIAMTHGLRSSGWCTGIMGSSRVVVAAGVDPATGRIDDATLALCVASLVQAQVDCVVIPLESPVRMPLTARAIDAAIAAGIPVVAAGGTDDSGCGRRHYPAAAGGVIAVGSCNNAGEVNLWSGGKMINDVYAPGFEVATVPTDGGGTVVSGTAYAAARVAAAVCLYYAYARSMGVERPNAARCRADVKYFGKMVQQSDCTHGSSVNVLDAEALIGTLRVPMVRGPGVPEGATRKDIELGGDMDAVDCMQSLLDWIVGDDDTTAITFRRASKSDVPPTAA